MYATLPEWKHLRKGEPKMRDADRIREYATEKYVLPARQQKQKRLSIRAGDVVRDLKLRGSTPAVCSALKTREFLQSNDLELVETSGPKSGQSTTVVYTYEFAGTKQSPPPTEDSWSRLRGALKDVFTELDGGEVYIREERSNFHPMKERK
jgi:hypothetical protein